MVEHSLFHESGWSRTNDLNTSLVLFRSPRDVQQIDVFGRQLNNPEFIRDCFEKSENRTIVILTLSVKQVTHYDSVPVYLLLFLHYSTYLHH